MKTSNLHHTPLIWIFWITLYGESCWSAVRSFSIKQKSSTNWRTSCSQSGMNNCLKAQLMIRPCWASWVYKVLINVLLDKLMCWTGEMSFPLHVACWSFLNILLTVSGRKMWKLSSFTHLCIALCSTKIYKQNMAEVCRKVSQSISVILRVIFSVVAKFCEIFCGCYFEPRCSCFTVLLLCMCLSIQVLSYSFAVMMVFIRLQWTGSRTQQLLEEICREWKGLCLCWNTLLFQPHWY